MRSTIISTTSDHIASGGTITGDLTISGDLTVTGSSTYTYDESVDGQMWVWDSGASASDAGGHLRIYSDDGAVMASGHRLGVIEFAGAEAAESTSGARDATKTVGARIESLTTEAWDASNNDADLLFYTTSGNASTTEKMRITSAGNVCIGGTTDEGFSTLLNIEGAGGTDDVPGILFKNTSASNDEVIMQLISAQSADSVASVNAVRESAADDAYLQFMTQATGGGLTERMRISSAGNVGIGGTGPIVSGEYATSTRLTIYDPTDGQRSILELAGNSDGDGVVLGAVHFSNNDNADADIADGGSKLVSQILCELQTDDTNAGDDSGGELLFYTKPLGSVTNSPVQLAMKIDSNQNVGINETAPVAKMHISTADSGVTPSTSADELMVENAGYCGITIASSTSTAGNIFFADSGDNGEGQITYKHGSGDNYMAFATSGNEAVRITEDGGIYEQGGVLKENLLTNSGFDVWSNSTLVEATSGAAPVLDGANAALVNNLVTNGGFDSATTGWTAGASATLSSEGSGKTGNCLKILENGGANPNAGITVTTVVGKLYQFNCYVNSGGSEASFQVNIGDSGIGSYNNYDSETQEASADWTSMVINVVFEATGTSTSIRLRQVAGSGSGTFILFDSVTLYEVTPGCVDAATTAFDGWNRQINSIDLIREHNHATYSKDGSFYSLKVVKGADASEKISTPIDAIGSSASHYQRFAGRTVTMGAWVYSVSATDNVRLAIHDGSWNYGSYVATAGSWQWTEFTHTMSASATNAIFGFDFNGDDTDVAYISQPMLVFGNSIGEGNYTRPQGEIVYLETASHRKLTSFDNATISSDTATVNLEAESEGRIPKGARAVQLRFVGKSTTVGAVMLIDNGDVRNNLHVYTQVNGAYVSGSAVVACDANGDIGIERSDTWTNCYIYYDAIHLR